MQFERDRKRDLDKEDLKIKKLQNEIEELTGVNLHELVTNSYYGVRQTLSDVEIDDYNKLFNQNICPKHIEEDLSNSSSRIDTRTPKQFAKTMFLNTIFERMIIAYMNGRACKDYVMEGCMSNHFVVKNGKANLNTDIYSIDEGHIDIQKVKNLDSLVMREYKYEKMIKDDSAKLLLVQAKEEQFCVINLKDIPEDCIERKYNHAWKKPIVVIDLTKLDKEIDYFYF